MACPPLLAEAAALPREGGSEKFRRPCPAGAHSSVCARAWSRRVGGARAVGGNVRVCAEPTVSFHEIRN